MRSRKSIDCTLSGDACILWALALLVLPLRWILAAAVAAVFHEGCHYLALRLCGVRVYGLRFGSAGAVMETEPMGRGKELVCALVGPFGSFLLVFLIRRFPELAICAGIQGLYNLLPIFPLDGGRAVRCLLGQGKAAECVEFVTITVIGLLGLYGYFVWNLGPGVLLASFLMIRRGLPGKIPCKDGRKRVQ